MHKFWKRTNEHIELNIKRLGIENFMNFQEVQATMLVMDKERAASQLEYIESKGFLDHETLLKDKVLGDNHPQKIHSLYHLYKFIENGGKIPSKGTIIEVGAGVGCMVDLIYKAGFTGKYHIIDSDTVNKIQKYYLTENGVNGVGWIGTKSNKVSMLIGTWSISETPLEDRRCANYFADQYLLAYGDVFNGELDNREFFEEFKSDRDVNWVEVPVFETQKYLFGYKKAKVKDGK